jgi:signal transduction histidine kinase
MSVGPTDLIISIAYFSIPVQILVSLWHYPRMAVMPLSILVLLVLFALFIFLCGAGHLLRCIGKASETTIYLIVNRLTAFISIITALYLLPLIPSVMSMMDEGIQSLTRLNAETEESKNQLLTFMAFLCHEIRNPLFAITSTLSFLEDDHEVLTREQSDDVNSIRHSSQLMLRLVNDVLDLHRIESGKLTLEERCFDVTEILRHVASSVEIQIRQQHANGAVTFIFSLCPTVPRYICGDSVRLLQFIYNMISNANKFTEKGTIALSVSTVD